MRDLQAHLYPHPPFSTYRPHRGEKKKSRTIAGNAAPRLFFTEVFTSSLEIPCNFVTAYLTYVYFFKVFLWPLLNQEEKTKDTCFGPWNDSIPPCLANYIDRENYSSQFLAVQVKSMILKKYLRHRFLRLGVRSLTPERLVDSTGTIYFQFQCFFFSLSFFSNEFARSIRSINYISIVFLRWIWKAVLWSSFTLVSKIVKFLYDIDNFFQQYTVIALYITIN